ncbi:hypothetical protein BDQ17DRAFT_1334303 [Cyathus striatus]|nr:hypothetical protein BDQ17DRAFT_1334303 [Cyathus striatus]
MPAKYLLRTANSRAPYGTFYYPSEDLQPQHGSMWDGRMSLDVRTRDDGDGDVDKVTVRMVNRIKGSTRGDKGYRTEKGSETPHGGLHFVREEVGLTPQQRNLKRESVNVCSTSGVLRCQVRGMIFTELRRGESPALQHIEINKKTQTKTWNFTESGEKFTELGGCRYIAFIEK